MTATTNDLTTTPSRTPLLAALGIAGAGVLTAIGTFWDSNKNGSSASEYAVGLGMIAVVAAIAYGLVVRTAPAGNPSRRAAILAVVALLSLAVFWSGAPLVLATGSIACTLIDKDRRGSYSAASKVAIGLAALTAVLATVLAFAG